MDEVLTVPRRGSINVHASLLPELRGAAPINWAIIRGHSHSGVTIMRMVRELDAGPILYRVATPLPEDITAGELYAMLSEMGATALVEALAQMEADAIEEAEQVHDRATYAPKLGRADARIDWALDAVSLDRWIRGCDPWPAAWSELDGLQVQLFAPRHRRSRVETASRNRAGSGSPTGCAYRYRRRNPVGRRGEAGGPRPDDHGSLGRRAGSAGGRPISVIVPRLHVICPDSELERVDAVGRLTSLLEAGGGSVAVHLRPRSVPPARCLAVARELVPRADVTGGWIVVNGRTDIARVAGAHAVQLGPRFATD